MNGRTRGELKGISQLGGKKAKYPFRYDPSLLESFPNKNPRSVQWISFVCTEFTSLCPVTGQPDFAKIFVNYIAGDKMVESKSLKLYLVSFRNQDAFHEDCTVAIGKRLFAFLKPKWLRIGGYWYPRGGIPIDVFWQAGKLPKGIWVPDQGVAPYRGRG